MAQNSDDDQYQNRIPCKFYDCGACLNPNNDCSYKELSSAEEEELESEMLYEKNSDSDLDLFQDQVNEIP
jgi:hypothetical protein